MIKRIRKLKPKAKLKRFLPLEVAVTPLGVPRRKRKSPVPFVNTPASASPCPTPAFPFGSQHDVPPQSSFGSPTPTVRPIPSDPTDDMTPLPLIDPDELYRGYIPKARRFMQSLPPDPPPLDSSSALTPPDPSSLTVHPSDPPPRPPLHSSSAVTPRDHSSLATRDHSSPVPHPPHAPSTAPDSFPSSPPPSLGSTPSLSAPHTYTDTTYTPVERDYAMDYEAVMISVEDMNRFSRFMFRGGVRRVSTTSGSEVYTREDVIPVLSELRDMLNRMFDRF